MGPLFFCRTLYMDMFKCLPVADSMSKRKRIFFVTVQLV